MPLGFVINKPRHLVFIRFSGVLTEQDLIAAADRVQADLATVTECDRIISLADVTEVAINTDAVRRLADRGQIIATGRRVIIGSRPIILGMARLFAQGMLQREGTTGVFPDLPGALEFLGLDPSTPWPDE